MTNNEVFLISKEHNDSLTEQTKTKSLEVYNTFFTEKESINKVELYTDLVDKFHLTELKDQLEEILDISKFSPEHLQDKILGPPTGKAYKKQESEKKWTDGYNMHL